MSEVRHYLDPIRGLELMVPKRYISEPKEPSDEEYSVIKIPYRVAVQIFKQSFSSGERASIKKKIRAILELLE